jgi:hypothetical protein
MLNIPKIKKEVKAFLLNEQGKVAKRSIIRAGVILGMASIASHNVFADAHCNGKGGANPDCHWNAKCPDPPDKVIMPDYQRTHPTIPGKKGVHTDKGDARTLYHDWHHHRNKIGWDRCYWLAGELAEHCNAKTHGNSLDLKTSGEKLIAKHAHSLIDENKYAKDHMNCDVYD